MTERDLIRSILDEAAPVALEKYRNRAHLKVSSKQNAVDLLTEADEFIQRFITERILRAYPDDLVIGEELGENSYSVELESRRAWVIDPIDGTQNFVRGLYPAFGISIGFVDKGKILAGGVHMPTINEQFLASKGEGATRNGEAISVSSIPTLNVARIEVDYGNPIHRANIVHALNDIVLQAGEVRCHCAAVVGLCSVACGEMDAYFHVHLKPWDYCAAKLIVDEAGGVVQQLNGQPIKIWSENVGLFATNGSLYEEVKGLIKVPNAK